MPDCEKFLIDNFQLTIEEGCLIPALEPDAARIMEMRDKLIALHDLVDSGTVLKMYDATMEDLDLLAAVEEEFNKAKGEGLKAKG